MAHLWELGHRRIACVSDLAINDGQMRIATYQRFLSEHGADDFQQVYEVRRSVEDGYQLGRETFATALSFTALFVATDTLAVGLIKAAHDMGITIPEQVSIIGYDDIAMAPYTVPALTTISQSGYRMGHLTASLLIEMIEQELVSEEVEDEVIVPTLVVRESTEIPPVL